MAHSCDSDKLDDFSMACSYDFPNIGRSFYNFVVATPPDLARILAIVNFDLLHSFHYVLVRIEKMVFGLPEEKIMTARLQ